MTRAQQIETRFTAFHESNPEVWRHFERLAFQLINAGRARYSSAAIFEQIRWEFAVSGAADDEVPKLNNDYRALYARLFHAAHPSHAGFFLIRNRPSESSPAHRDPNAPIDDTPAAPDPALDARLRQIDEDTPPCKYVP